MDGGNPWLSEHQSGPQSGQVQPQWRRGLLGQNESQVSNRGGVGWLWQRWRLGPWLSLTMLTQTFCRCHIKCCPLLRGENEGWVSYRVPWGALWSVTWRDVGSGTANIYSYCMCLSVYQSICLLVLSLRLELYHEWCADTNHRHMCLCVCLLIL